MLEVTNLTGGWQGTTIVEDVSLRVASGETVAIVGRNGVGKTTLLEIIVGRAPHRAGTIRLANDELDRMGVHRRSNAGIGYVPQSREIFGSLSVRENLEVAVRPGAWTIDRVLDLFPGLRRRLANLGKHLSGGEQQMLAIARALVGNPKLIIMDEPSEGLAPVVIEQLTLALRSVMADRSLAILLVEQRIDVALALSDRCLVMDRGRVVFAADSESLQAGNADFARLTGLDAEHAPTR